MATGQPMFSSAAIGRGLDAVILDPTNGKLLGALKASLMLMGQDDFCMSFIKAFREGQIWDEAAMDIIRDDLAAESGKQALNVSNRFSPGYCERSLTDIHQLISMLPPDFCNISLNDAAFMIPAKSICGIIGIGRKVIRSEYQCGRCDLEACVYRNKFLPGR